MDELFLFKFTYAKHPTCFVIAKTMSDAVMFVPYSDDAIVATRVAVCDSIRVGGSEVTFKGDSVDGLFVVPEEF